MKTFLLDFDQKYFFSILLAFAFALPFNTLPAINSILITLLFLLWMFKIYNSRGKILFKTPLDIPLLGFFAWAGFSLFWTADFHESLNSWIALGKQIFLFYLVATTVKNKDQFTKILIAFLVAIAITDIDSIGNFFYRGGNVFDRNLRAGTFGSIDSHGLISLLVMFIPLAFIYGIHLPSKTTKIILYLFVIISTITLYLSFTRAGWLAVCIELLIFGWFYHRKFFYFFSFLLVTGFILTVFIIKHVDSPSLNQLKKIDLHMTDTESIGSRVKVWKLSVLEILDRPITGFGYGKGIFYKINKNTEIIREAPHIHDTFLETAFELGIPGLILLAIIFWQVFSRGFNLFKRSNDSFISLYSFFMVVMVGGLLFRNIFDHMFIGNLAEIFWFLTGLLFTFQLKTIPDSIEYLEQTQENIAVRYNG